MNHWSCRWSFAECWEDFWRLKSQSAGAYLQSAKILTDIPAYAIWWRPFTKAPYSGLQVHAFVHPMGDQDGNQALDCYILMRSVAVGGSEETKIFLLYFFCLSFVTSTSSTFCSSHVIVHCLCFVAAIYWQILISFFCHFFCKLSKGLFHIQIETWLVFLKMVSRLCWEQSH